VTSANHKHGDQFTVQIDGELVDLDGVGIGLVVIDHSNQSIIYKNKEII